MDRNTLLAFFLIALVLVFTPYYMETFAPPPEPDVTSQDTTKITYTKKQTTPDPTIEKAPVFISKTNIPEKTFTVKTDLYTAIVSSNSGGTIRSITYNNYFYQDSSNIELINADQEDNLLIKFINLDGESVDLRRGWSTSEQAGEIYIESTKYLSFEYLLPNGSIIKKTLSFHPDSYVIDINTDLSDASQQVFSGVYSLGWYGGLKPTEQNLKEDQTYFYSYAYLGGELEDLKVSANESDSLFFNGAADWVAIRTKYFLASLVSGENTSAVSSSIFGRFKENEVYGASLFFPSSSPSNVSLYLGPLEYDRVQTVGKELSRVMNFGWGPIRPIAKGILYVLKKLNNYIPNYGFVLILFAIGVKLLVYPLTKKSYQSTAAMQQLQPEISALREKHKNNPQKLNQATMELYKTRGVNPLGGCLPMLLQMPLLLSLFIVFRSTIELRAEPFVWWIKDLSAPDAVLSLPFSIPIYGSHVAILPILMVVSMFIQQRLMTGGAAQQPQQKMMQYFMTAFFFLMFNTFPSGLNLYYTLFNVFSIIQQKLIPPTEPVNN